MSGAGGRKGEQGNRVDYPATLLPELLQAAGARGDSHLHLRVHGRPFREDFQQEIRLMLEHDGSCHEARRTVREGD